MKQKKFTAVLAVILSLVLSVALFAGCAKKEEKPYEITKRASTGWEDEKVYTNNDYTSQMPNQWCSILTSDNTNTSLEGYFTSSFYEFNYQYDANGDIVPGGFTVDYSAATKLEDVTAKYAGQYGLAADATSGQAFAMTLRNDLTWDDGTAIKAEDFVYSMKQQLSPKYLFDTASNYYSGNYIIHNAQNYVMQGQSGWFSAVDLADYGDDIATDAWDGLYFDASNVNAFSYIFENTDMTKLSNYKDYFVSNGKNVYDELVAFAGDNRTPFTTEIANKLAGLFASGAPLSAYWGWADTEVGYFTVANYTYPEVDFSEVGYFVGENEYELVMVIDNELAPLNEDGSLTYEAGYYFSSWPLVKKDIWERCEDSTKTPYANSYCTSVETSASWGPYKITNYQDQKTYTVSRNDEWFGYGLDQYKGQYQTDNIVTQKIDEWDTAWMAFQNGELDGIGMDVKIASDYRTSRQAYFTPETYTFDLNIQSVVSSHDAERNNLLLKYDDFRKAISLSLDRDDFCAKNSPSSQAALGLLNNMYYYDVANGKVYRESTQAKEAILNAYGATKNDDGSWTVGDTNYTDIDDALDAMTGYNLTLARQLVDKAVDAAIAKGEYIEGEKVVLTYGTETQTANSDRVLNWFQSAFDEMTKGTKLEGKIEIKYFFFSNATWSEQFADGEYDLCFGAWGSAAFNPAYLLCATQIDAENRYAVGWNPADIIVTVKATPDENHKDGVYKYNLEQWSANLQGKSGCDVNFMKFPVDDQLAALGAVETAILNAYYSIPVYSRYSASLMGYKCDYYSYEYNTFMGYGGIRYMSYNFDDTEWAAFVKEKGGKLNYKFGK